MNRTKIFRFLLLFLLISVFSTHSAISAEEDKKIPKNISKIINQVTKNVNENVKVQLLEKELGILFFHDSGNPFCVILFMLTKNYNMRSKNFDQLVRKTTKKFLNGGTKNIKAVFWHNENSNMSWTRKNNQIKKEVFCSKCFCSFGSFSDKLCKKTCANRNLNELRM